MKCEVTIEDFANGKSYSGLRSPMTVPKMRQCSRTAKKRLGPLALCATHVKMAKDGFVDEHGNVTCRTDRQNYQRGLVPGRPYSWADKLKSQNLK